MARVCVFCASSDRIHPSYVALADEIGRRLAAAGHDLVSGGGRVSMMGAVARAVRAEGRHTLGVIPQTLVGREVADDDADELVVTADMRERKGRMDAAADAFLALPGGLGTLEELLEVWVAGTLGMHAKPVVVLDPSGLLAGLQILVDKLVSQGFVRPSAAARVVWTVNVDEALAALAAGLVAGTAAQALGTSIVPTSAAEELLEAEPSTPTPS